MRVGSGAPAPCLGGSHCQHGGLDEILYKSCSRVFPRVSANDGKHVQTVLVKENQCLIYIGLSCLETRPESRAICGSSAPPAGVAGSVAPCV